MLSRPMRRGGAAVVGGGCQRRAVLRSSSRQVLRRRGMPAPDRLVDGEQRLLAGYRRRARVCDRADGGRGIEYLPRTALLAQQDARMRVRAVSTSGDERELAPD
jgi:hypothetical protein